MARFIILILLLLREKINVDNDSIATDILLAEWSVCITFWELLAWDTIRSAALVVKQIWSGVSGFQWQSVKVHLDRYPRASGDRPPGSNPAWRCYVYRLVPEAPLFREMPTGPEAFLETAGVPELT